MSQVGEGRDRARGEPPPDRRRVRVRISLFFDGTGNNRANVRHREGDTRTYWWMRNTVPGPTASYENDLSNVVRLFENVEPTAAGFTAYLRVYTEGIGTTDGYTDSRLGAGTGTGSTGVREKVSRGLRQAVAELSRRFPASDTYLEHVSVDTCGFSRGAAAARHCVQRVLDGTRGFRRLRSWLETMGYAVGQVDVPAVGLFDTVSSHGVTLASYDNDVTELGLDAIRQALAVYQLAAAEEYRTRFGLTTIESAGGKGRQVYLPGAHSDVGGGYLTGPEDQTLVTGAGALPIARFLLARGWYLGTTEGPELAYRAEIPGETFATPYGPGFRPTIDARLAANRGVVRNAYSFIPLHLMADWFRERGVPVRRAELAAKYDPEGVPGRARIEAEAKSGRPTTARYWEDDPDPTLRDLRHGFLHISFSTTPGMAPHMPPGSPRPWRIVFSG